ncbi:hypothetical protein V6N11_033739 [Hibiscus sabdariffa]|uniref:Uncharacterized protein n=1 Tax=Hibiscus sabdariffa TaxID=183260 RepID=A0ABR2S0M1_9ROSI
MEGHAHSFLASKCDVKSMAETYASGVVIMKELANKIQRNTSSVSEKMNFAFSSQIEVIENQDTTFQVAYKKHVILMCSSGFEKFIVIPEFSE